MPQLRVDGVERKPIFDETPNTDGVATVDKKMIRRLHGPLAKWTKSTILPPSLLKPIRRAKPILDGNPREKLDFGRSPNFPNHRLHVS